MVEKDNHKVSKNPQKIVQSPQIDPEQAELLRVEEEREFTILDVLKQRKVEPSACESLADPSMFGDFISKGWLSLRSSLFNEITEVYRKERRELPSIEGILHLEVLTNVRRIGGETAKEYLSLMRKDERFGPANTEFNKERIFITPHFPLFPRD